MRRQRGAICEFKPPKTGRTRFATEKGARKRWCTNCDRIQRMGSWCLLVLYGRSCFCCMVAAWVLATKDCLARYVFLKLGALLHAFEGQAQTGQAIWQTGRAALATGQAVLATSQAARQTGRAMRRTSQAALVTSQAMRLRSQAMRVFCFSNRV